MRRATKLLTRRATNLTNLRIVDPASRSRSLFQIISEIMADQAGPSGAGNAAVGKTVEETQFLFNTGVACIKVAVDSMAEHLNCF